eukprot:jgi/Psemu1/25487/gm1.25487_g
MTAVVANFLIGNDLNRFVGVVHESPTHNRQVDLGEFASFLTNTCSTTSREEARSTTVYFQSYQAGIERLADGHDLWGDTPFEELCIKEGMYVGKAHQTEASCSVLGIIQTFLTREDRHGIWKDCKELEACHADFHNDWGIKKFVAGLRYILERSHASVNLHFFVTASGAGILQAYAHSGSSGSNINTDHNGSMLSKHLGRDQLLLSNGMYVTDLSKCFKTSSCCPDQRNRCKGFKPHFDASTNKLWYSKSTPSQTCESVYINGGKVSANKLPEGVKFHVILASVSTESDKQASNWLRLQKAWKSAKRTLNFQEMQNRVANVTNASLKATNEIGLTQPTVKVNMEYAASPPVAIATAMNEVPLFLNNTRFDPPASPFMSNINSCACDPPSLAPNFQSHQQFVRHVSVEAAKVQDLLTLMVVSTTTELGLLSITKELVDTHMVLNLDFTATFQDVTDQVNITATSSRTRTSPRVMDEVC